MQMVSRNRRVPFFLTRGLASGDHPWAGFSFEHADSPAVPLGSHSWSKTTLLYVTGEQASLRWKHRGTWSTDAIQSGTVSIVRRDVEIQSAVPSGSVPIMLLQLDNSRLQHLAADQVNIIDQSLQSAQVTSDYRLAALLAAMREEVAQGCPSGRIYGESISLALLAYLAGRYATPPHLAGDAVTLSQPQKRKVVDYVRGNLASNISVTELAGLAQMSPSYFARVFKASFGVTPYRFVMQERIEAAKRMLGSTRMTARHVSTAFGFSSQSHFVKVFRQFTGVTPKQYRAGL
jgi:AraC family transcriptional regulator